MLVRGRNYVQLESIYNLFYKPQRLLKGRINRGVGGTPLTQTDLMRRRQKVEYAFYSPVPNPSDEEILNMEEMKSIEG